MKFIKVPPTYTAETTESIKDDLWRLVSTVGFRKEFSRNIYYEGEAGVNYRYSNIDHVGHGFSPIMKDLKAWVEWRLSTIGIHENFNHILCNSYFMIERLAAHKDDEPELEGGIASFSLGCSAIFSYGKTRACLNDVTIADKDLWYGDREFFDTCYHKVSSPEPDGDHESSHRLNFTLRTVKC
jgi:alkylated DNA repair dioxygenase AlkB